MNMRVEEEEPGGSGGNPVHGAKRAENMKTPQTGLVQLVRFGSI